MGFKQISKLKFRQRWLYGLLSLVVALGITLTTPQAGYSFSLIDLIFRGVQVIQLSNISDKQEVELGKQINQQLVSSNNIKLYKNSQINSYVNQLGQKLAKTSDRPNIPYTFQVVQDDSVNAFATMGGYVYIHTGLLKEADNEAELAGVLAHEIGHIVGRHGIEQMRQQAIAQGLLSAAGLDQSTAVQIGVELALRRPNSRGDEFEADELGLANLKAAGFAPIGLVNFMKKLQEQGGSIPAFLSTHPGAGDRVERLQQMIEPGTANSGTGLNQQAYRQRIQPLL